MVYLLLDLTAESGLLKMSLRQRQAYYRNAIIN